MISEEIIRIKEIMNLNEGPTDPKVLIAKRFAVFLEKILGKSTSSEFSSTLKQQTDELSNIIKRIKTKGVDDLTEGELLKLLKSFDSGKLASLIYKQNIIHPNISNTLEDVSREINEKIQNNT